MTYQPPLPAVLLFGGTGFIGKHLCNELHRCRIPALVVSRTPDFRFLSEHAPHISAVTSEEFEASRDVYLRSARTLVYLVSASLPGTFNQTPWQEASANVEPAFRLFSLAASTNAELKIVLVSSGGTVYGAGSHHPLPEDTPLRPISPYGYGKVAIEMALEYVARTQGVKYAIIRASNPVGRWQTNPQHGIVNVAMRAAATRNAVTLFDGGNQVRDFVDADDLARALCMVHLDQRHDCSIWNAGSGHPTRIASIVDIVERAVSQPIERQCVAARPFDVPYIVLDCAKIERELGWKATTSVEESVSKVAEARLARVEGCG